MDRDWLFKENNEICSFRTAGVLIRDDKLLVQREKDGHEYALPGGHVKIGESAETSLIREYFEETGVQIICERLIWIEEVFWKWQKQNLHTLTFYFLIHLENDHDLPDDYIEAQKDNSEIILHWLSLKELQNVVIYPDFIRDKIENISLGIEHFVTKS